MVHVVSTDAPEKERIKCRFVLLGGEKGSLFFHWPPPFLTDMSRLETCQFEQNACPIIGLMSFLIDTCLDLTIAWTAISAVLTESNAR